MTQLPLSAPDWCFLSKAGCPPAEYYRRLRALGFAAAEMVAPENRAAARDAGLAVLNMSGPGMQQGFNRREHHATLVPEISKRIAEAARDRVAQVIVFSGNRAGLDDASGRAATVEALRVLAPEAEAAGVMLVLEALCQQFHADYQADRSAWAFKVIDAVGSPAVRVLYDAFHMEMMDEDVVATVSANIPRIAHIHLAEAPGRTVLRRNGRPDHRAVAAAAHAAGYRGHLGLEFLVKGDCWSELAEAVAALA